MALLLRSGLPLQLAPATRALAMQAKVKQSRCPRRGRYLRASRLGHLGTHGSMMLLHGLRGPRLRNLLVRRHPQSRSPRQIWPASNRRRPRRFPRRRVPMRSQAAQRAIPRRQNRRSLLRPRQLPLQAAQRRPRALPWSRPDQPRPMHPALPPRKNLQKLRQAGQRVLRRARLRRNRRRLRRGPCQSRQGETAPLVQPLQQMQRQRQLEGDRSLLRRMMARHLGQVSMSMVLTRMKTHRRTKDRGVGSAGRPPG